MRNLTVFVASLALLSLCASAEAKPKRKPSEATAETPLPPPPADLTPPSEPVPPAAATAPAAPVPNLWFRDAGEYLAYRSVRTLAPTEVSTKLVTDFKRFDAGIGKRIPIYNWGDETATDTWSVGVDGGMLASLIRYTNQGRLTFATNTFDGYFGTYLGFLNGDGWLGMLRFAHLSAHLVDNSPLINLPLAYSQFWTEVIVGKSFPEIRRESDWNLHLQATVGMNNTSIPSVDQPRADLSADFGYALGSPDSLAILANADALRAGVQNQSVTYLFFLGLGYLSRPQTKHRPFRFGVAHFRGSDYRNQLYFNRQNWTTFEMAAEF